MPKKKKLKICFKCHKKKSLDLFYKHPEMTDGYLGKCKACAKNDTNAHYRENRERILGEMKVYRGLESTRKRVRKYNKQWFSERPGARRAWAKVSNAVMRGKLKKEPCEICGSKEVEAHHDDYRKPLDVRWLCMIHHKGLHGFGKKSLLAQQRKGKKA